MVVVGVGTYKMVEIIPLLATNVDMIIPHYKKKNLKIHSV
jgi:hypothetical protein